VTLNAKLVETIRGIRRGLEQAQRGEGRSMRSLLEELARKRKVKLTGESPS
jgi:hypothetical protein